MSAELVPVPSVLLERVASLGVDVAILLRQARILPSRFKQPRTRLTVDEFFAFWRALEEVGGSRDLALRIGTEAMPQQLDVASLAALHSATLGEALNKFSRYKRLVCGERVMVDTSAGEARITFQWVHTQASLPMMLVDATFASLLALGRRGSGQSIVPLRVELARRRSDEAMLKHHFGCEVRFDTPIDVLVLERQTLSLPFTTHNADLLAVMLPGMETALNESLATHSISDDVKIILSRRMCGERPSVERVAAEMRLSPRTLQRRLGEAGTTYQAVLDDVRRDTSRRLLANTDLDAGEIAFVLGFEELNSFNRAFHAWEGVTPTRWRGAESRT